MKTNLNTNCFMLKTKNKITSLEMTDDFNELSNVLTVLLNKWNEVQCRNDAMLSSTISSATRLISHAETIISVCNKAIENNKEN